MYRPTRFDGGGDDLVRVEGLDFELDLAARDARYIKQIVDQPHELSKLAPDNLPCPFALSRIIVAYSKDFNRVANRRKRITQLVRKHGQKLVFAAIFFLNLGVKSGIVERNGCAASKVGGHSQCVGIKFASGGAYTK